MSVSYHRIYARNILFMLYIDYISVKCHMYIPSVNNNNAKSGKYKLILPEYQMFKQL